MKDRTRTRSVTTKGLRQPHVARTIASAAPAPMPGRLPVSDITARTSRSLYAEARRYESWARNIADGHTNSTDSNGRVWTLDEIHAHVWDCRKAGTEAERAENASTAANIRSFPTQQDEALRRTRVAEAAKQLSANGQRMAQRVHSRALSDAFQKLAFAALPHLDNELTGPMTQVQVHTPFGELVLSMDLPKQLVDTLVETVRATAELVAETAPAEHARAADTAPVRTLRSIPGGATR